MIGWSQPEKPFHVGTGAGAGRNRSPRTEPNPQPEPDRGAHTADMTRFDNIQYPYFGFGEPDRLNRMGEGRGGRAGEQPKTKQTKT